MIHTAQRAILMLLVALLAASCGGGGNSPGEHALAPLSDAVLQVDRGQLLDDASEALAADLSAAGTFVLSELATRVPLGVRVQSSKAGFVRIDGRIVATNQTHPVTVGRIGEDREIRIEYLDAEGRTVAQVLRTRPRGMPQFTVRGQTSSSGEIALTAGGTGFRPYLLLLDGSGNILYYKRSSDQNLNDFKRHRVGGRDYYSYMQGVRILPVGYSEGRIYIMDASFNVVNVLDGLQANAAKGRPALSSESHDFLMLGENHFVLSAYYGTLVDNIPGAPAGTRLVSSVLQEVRDVVRLRAFQQHIGGPARWPFRSLVP